MKEVIEKARELGGVIELRERQQSESRVNDALDWFVRRADFLIERNGWEDEKHMAKAVNELRESLLQMMRINKKYWNEGIK